mmetsp:Transcript_52031/g.110550  ORF Transcript_52031/g.110550 Transcript_52031/m.110550 type:complete len:296 (-) Transcript_52031:197-1084(-)
MGIGRVKTDDRGFVVFGGLQFRLEDPSKEDLPRHEGALLVVGAVAQVGLLIYPLRGVADRRAGSRPPPPDALVRQVPQSHPGIARRVRVRGLSVVKVSLAQVQAVFQLLVVPPRQELAHLTRPVQVVSRLAGGHQEGIVPFFEQKVGILIKHAFAVRRLPLLLRHGRGTYVRLQVAIPNARLLVLPVTLPALIRRRAGEGRSGAMPDEGRHVHQLGRNAADVTEGRYGARFHLVGGGAVRWVLFVLRVGVLLRRLLGCRGRKIRKHGPDAAGDVQLVQQEQRGYYHGSGCRRCDG